MVGSTRSERSGNRSPFHCQHLRKTILNAVVGTIQRGPWITGNGRSGRLKRFKRLTPALMPQISSMHTFLTEKKKEFERSDFDKNTSLQTGYEAIRCVRTPGASGVRLCHLA